MRCSELPLVMKCSSTGLVSSPLVSGAVFLNYWRSRQFHPACQRLAILLRILPRNRHEIFTSLYRHPGVGVITRQRGSVYHGGRSNLGSLFRNQAASIMQGSPHFVSRIWGRRQRWNNNHGSEFWSVLITGPFHQPSCNFDRRLPFSFWRHHSREFAAAART